MAETSQVTPEADAKVKRGNYPLGDLPNLFGVWYNSFFEAYQKTGDKDGCWPAFMAVVGIAKSNDDSTFQKAYDDAAKDGKFTMQEMLLLVHEALASMRRRDAYDWPQVPYFASPSFKRTGNGDAGEQREENEKTADPGLADGPQGGPVENNEEEASAGPPLSSQVRTVRAGGDGPE